MKRTLMLIVQTVVLKTAFAGIDLAPIKTGHDRNQSPLCVELSRLGTLRPRTANEIHGSNWTLGCECLDRDFTDFGEYKDYIVPLGIKEIRLFAGWAKCERKPGEFDFAWLDRCVDWANANRINVYLDISYGNPIYKGAGGAGLANGTPDTPEGLAKWDAWVETLATHYKGRIRDFATWNEPDNGGMNPPPVIADLCVRTARILKRLIPDCRVHGLSLASNEPELFETCLVEIAKLGGIDLFDTFVYHGYAVNPDSSYARVKKLQEICAKYAPKARMRQGENGCPSEFSDRFALWLYPWSENSQAKWNMRRMLGDLGHDCGSTVYSICDLQYRPPHAPYVYQNRKGLLRANANRQVYQVKKAYYAVQNVASLFDDTLVRVRQPGVSTCDRTLALYEYAKDARHPLFVFWTRGLVDVNKRLLGKSWEVSEVRLNELDYRQSADGTWRLENLTRAGIPSDDFTTRPIVLEWTGAPLKDPVWIDLFTGAVYAFPAKLQIVHSAGVSFVHVPAYDSPCVLTERAAVDFECEDQERMSK